MDEWVIGEIGIEREKKNLQTKGEEGGGKGEITTKLPSPKKKKRTPTTGILFKTRRRRGERDSYRYFPGLYQLTPVGAAVH